MDTNCTFDPAEKYTSIVTDYQLVCSNRYLAALSTTIYFAGVTIGALIFGPLSDYIGRRRTLQITTTGQILMGLCIHFESFTPTATAFTALRFIQGSFTQGLQTIAYTSLIEFTPVRLRTFMGCLWEVFWAMGLMYVGALSSVNHHWRTLQLYLLIPTAIGMIVTWIIPESLHWTWSRNKFRQTIANYTKIADRNGDKRFLEEEQTFQTDKDWRELETECRLVDEKSSAGGVQSSLFIIFRNSVLRKHILVMSLLWFTVTMCYYVITFYLPNVAGDRHVNFIMGAGVEVIAYTVTYLTMQRFGRPKVLGVFMLLYSALLIAFAAYKIMEVGGSDTPAIVLLLLAKGLSVSGFCGMYIFTGELFPTICRGTVFGFCGFCSRVGSLIAPQIVSWTELVNPGLPMFLLSGLVILAGSLMFILPETLKIQIPNTIQDVQELWGGRKKERKRNLWCCRQ